ncbi:VanW family protein [Streptomyces specialis]|uniref:VanW family protein n=1 Tax=Streptomyces specialis TaxID=498367 RepID=UPI000AFC49F6|nr:VanW family protein [Streptomyces specialis]
MAAYPPFPAEPPHIARHRAVTRRPAVIAIGVALTLAALYLIGSLLTGGEIAGGTSVQGVDIGGMSPGAARDKLTEELAWTRTEPIEVTIGENGDVQELDPVELGLTVDIDATVDQAEVPGLLGSLFGTGGGELEPVVRQDEEAGRSELTALAQDSATSLREGAVGFENGEVSVTEPRPGTELDVDRALDLLRDRFPDIGEPLPLPVREAEPVTGPDEIERAVEEFAEPAMSGPVVLTADEERITVPTEVIGDHLTMTADDTGRLEPALDGEALAADERLADAFENAGTEPTDATLRLEGSEVVVAADGTPGTRVVTDGLGETVLPLLTGRGDEARTAALRTEEVAPEVTADTYQDLGIMEQMSTFTVNFDPAPYRTTNIGRAAELINGSVVLPGEEWSFNETVGERTEANGFVEGLIILDDQYQQAQGGGVSAVATTMFNAVFFAGVDPVEYGAHSFYIERYPEGREATVAWGSLDLRWVNDSGNAIYVAADATDTSVTISFFGTKRYDDVQSETGPRENIEEPERREDDSEEGVPQPPMEGFDVEVDRILLDGGEEVGRETFRTHYVPRDEVVCVGGDGGE